MISVVRALDRATVAAEMAIVVVDRVKIHVMPHVVRALDAQEIVQIPVIHTVRQHVLVIVAAHAEIHAVIIVE